MTQDRAVPNRCMLRATSVGGVPKALPVLDLLPPPRDGVCERETICPLSRQLLAGAASRLIADLMASLRLTGVWQAKFSQT